MRKKLFIVLAIFAALAGAWALRARRHASAPSADAAVHQHWVCPMRCLHRVYDKPGKCPVCHMELILQEAPAQPLGYKCPLHYSNVLFDKPGRCPFCTLQLKPVFAEGKEPPAQALEQEAWPRVQGRTAVYFRPYTVALQPIDRTLRLAGKVSPDHQHLSAALPAGETLPPLGTAGMLAPAEGYFRPLLGFVDQTGAGKVRVRATRRLEGVEHAVVELRLAGPQVLAVPQEALKESDGHAWVFRERGGAYEPVSVTVGLRGERFVELRSGVAAGDVVAGSGVFWVEAQWRLDHPGEEL
jgi:hypothetical protein